MAPIGVGGAKSGRGGANQAYDSRDFHVCPHYTQTAAQVVELKRTAHERDIPVKEYLPDQDYLDKDAFIRVVNWNCADPFDKKPCFEAIDEINMEEIGSMLFKEGKPLSAPALKTDRGNFVLNVGVCSQVFTDRLAETDKITKSICNLIRGSSSQSLAPSDRGAWGGLIIF
eukprot:COSAG02_NODE_5574_length_4220_cov_12.097792_3_plen_171_part_00